MTIFIDTSGTISISDTAVNSYSSPAVLQNDGTRYLTRFYCLSSLSNATNVIQLSWSGNHFGGAQFEHYTTDTGSFSFDQDVHAIGAFNALTVTIGSFNTPSAGVIALGGFEYFENTGETLSTDSPFTVPSSITGSGSQGATASIDYITTSGQTGLTPDVKTSAASNVLMAIGGSSFVVSAAGGFASLAWIKS